MYSKIVFAKFSIIFFAYSIVFSDDGILKFNHLLFILE